LIIVPSYLAREDDSLEMLTPEKLCEITKKPDIREAAILDEKLKATIQNHVKNGDLVLCLTAGGGGSLDEWLRTNFNL
jgi:UDP-N-acetylmuramate--alanine ligase